MRGVGTENNLFFTQAPFPFHVWLNRNFTIHPYWCTGVYRIQNRSRKYLQTCFLPMQEKRLDYSIEHLEKDGHNSSSIVGMKSSVFCLGISLTCTGIYKRGQ